MKASEVPESWASANMEKLSISLGDENVDRPNFYKNLCRVLEEHLKVAEEESTADHAISAADLLTEPYWPVYKELKRLIKAGRTLIEDCNEEICQKAYLRLGERTEVFAETVKEIRWCTSLILYCKRKKLGQGNAAMKMDDFPQAGLGQKELYLLGKAAYDDQREIHTSLDMWIEKHLICSAEECGRSPTSDDNASCLAAQIKDQRNRMHSEAEQTPLLWLNREVLKGKGYIDHGGYGTVHEVMWLGDKYAIKELNDGPCGSLEDEAKAMAKLCHPHIVKPLASSSPNSSGQFFFLMELFPFNLLKYMKEVSPKQLFSPFSLSAGINLMLQISEAMRYVHDKGMVHRDLKPQNILVRPVNDPELTNEGFVVAKVADFGLARVKPEVISASSLTPGLLGGDPEWKAPEVLSAYTDDPRRLQVHYTRKADVFSFGIICSQVLTGTNSPYDQNTREFGSYLEIYTKLTEGMRPRIPDSCPRSLAALIRKCWDTNPLKRPTFEEVSTKLRHLEGLLLLSESLDGIEEQTPERLPFRTDMVMTQGPFGVQSYTRPLEYYSVATGIRAVQVFTRDHPIPPYGSQVIGFRVQYDLNGQTFEILHGSDKQREKQIPAWIRFKYPSEYLIRVEGLTTLMPNVYHKDYPGPFVTSLTFITNKGKYGPHGLINEPKSSSFSTTEGRVVGFFGWSGSLLHSIGVLTESLGQRG